MARRNWWLGLLALAPLMGASCGASAPQEPVFDIVFTPDRIQADGEVSSVRITVLQSDGGAPASGSVSIRSVLGSLSRAASRELDAEGKVTVPFNCDGEVDERCLTAPSVNITVTYGDFSSSHRVTLLHPCTGASLIQNGVCVNVASALSKLRWNLPCIAAAPLLPYGCQALDAHTQTLRVGGVPGSTYDVRLRFRGVVEQMTYLGGTGSGYWLSGATPDVVAYNVYSLQVTNPPSTYYLNAGVAGIPHCYPIDYQATIRVKAGTGLTLDAKTRDGLEIKNIDESGQPIVIPGIAPAPLPYNGQFIQMDVLSVSLVPELVGGGSGGSGDDGARDVR